MICPTCGKPEGTLKEEISRLHEQGLTPAEIREALVKQGWGKHWHPNKQITRIHHVIHYELGAKYHKKHRSMK